MRLKCLGFVLVVAISAAARGQAVTEWRTRQQVPVAVVEMPGGDLEHVAAWVPAGGFSAEMVKGAGLRVEARSGGLLGVASVPAMAFRPTLDGFLTVVRSSGAAALVFVGPVPARELDSLSEALDAVPWQPLGQSSCPVADGGLEVLRGRPERIELRLAAPAPSDPRSALVLALESWVQARLAPLFRGVRVDIETASGCSWLVVRLETNGVDPYDALAQLRQKLAELAVARPDPTELARLKAGWSRRITLLAGDGGAAAASLAELVAAGGRAGSWAHPQLWQVDDLARLIGEVLSGRSGAATLFEAERRAVQEPVVTLGNGVTLSLSWITADVGVIGFAFGGLIPPLARGCAEAVAARAVHEGWGAVTRELLGAVTAVVTVPAEDIVAALEATTTALREVRAPGVDGLLGDVWTRLDLARVLRSDGVSVALALPPAADQGREAAEKFLLGLTATGVRSGAIPPAAGLEVVSSAAAPEIAGIVETSVDAAGLVAMEIVSTRLKREPGLSVLGVLSPGRAEVIVIGVGADDSIETLDRRLAASWKGACGVATEEEVGRAKGRVSGALFGDLAVTTGRRALLALCPGLARQEDLLALAPGDVNRSLKALPPWLALPRVAHGPAPGAVPQGVAKSRPPGPGGRSGLEE